MEASGPSIRMKHLFLSAHIVVNTGRINDCHVTVAQLSGGYVHWPPGKNTHRLQREFCKMRVPYRRRAAYLSSHYFTAHDVYRNHCPPQGKKREEPSIGNREERSFHRLSQTISSHTSPRALCTRPFRCKNYNLPFQARKESERQAPQRSQSRALNFGQDLSRWVGSCELLLSLVHQQGVDG